MLTFSLAGAVNSCLKVRHGIRTIVTHHKPSYAESQVNKTFFLTVLSATATKRDAKTYIEKYQQPYTSAEKVKVKDSKTLDEFFGAGDGTLIDVEPSLNRKSPARVALITIRDPKGTSERQLLNIAHTLAQLHRLGLQPVVIVDTHTDESPTSIGHQALRFAQILESIGLEARPLVDGLFHIPKNDMKINKMKHTKRTVAVYDTRVIQAPVSRRQVPVIRTAAVDHSGRKKSITADSAMKALCRVFGHQTAEGEGVSGLLIIDKLIILDTVGGILSPQRKEGSHVFINLDQEALLLQRELATLASPQVAEKHLRNLETCQACLDLLSDSASAVVTTPEIAGSVKGVQHPLIHNLLTDKPMFSPSLPVKGFRTPTTVTTILRKGVPVQIFRKVSLTNSEIDLPKLVTLINDSFGRKLDVDAYLRRIGGQVEALIVAGDYDGAAIVTSEAPDPSSPSPLDHASGDSHSEQVPYLDKFAVMRAKQGSGGVADILFNAMMKEFPHELIWRSRNENPVNKWYFERATGTLLVPPQQVTTDPHVIQDDNKTRTKKEKDTKETKWRLFWTAQPKSRARFDAYIQVARKIQPTWLT